MVLRPVKPAQPVSGSGPLNELVDRSLYINHVVLETGQRNRFTYNVWRFVRVKISFGTVLMLLLFRSLSQVFNKSTAQMHSYRNLSAGNFEAVIPESTFPERRFDLRNLQSQEAINSAEAELRRKMLTSTSEVRRTPD